MTAAQRPTDYDVVVVGSGLGGLSAGALLAHSGARTLVVEQAEEPGGYARAFSRGNYRFDAAVHVTLEAAPGRLTANLLDHLGVGDLCRFVAIGDPYTVAMPDLLLRLPNGLDPYIEAHAKLFPHEADALRRYFEMRMQLFIQMARMPQQIGVTELAEAMRVAPLVFRFRSATVQEVLDQYFTDDRLKALLGVAWPYVGSPPSRLSFLLYSQVMELLVTDARYALGSFQTLVDALVAGLERSGGQLVTGRAVERITVDDGAVTGVVLDDGSEVSTRVVVSNADALHTFRDLVGEDLLPRRFRKRLERATPSHSAVVLYTAYEGEAEDIGLPHETFVYRHWDHDQTEADILAGRPGGVWISVPTGLDPSLAPPGVQLVTISALAPYEVAGGWQERLPSYTEELLELVGNGVPALAGTLEVVDVATPETLQRRTRNFAGAIYGWDNTPNQVASKRLGHRTPIDGLLLSGHWSAEGSSSFRALLSGIETARMVAEDIGARPVPELRGANITALH